MKILLEFLLVGIVASCANSIAVFRNSNAFGEFPENFATFISETCSFKNPKTERFALLLK